jgi:hypothetical protein
MNRRVPVIQRFNTIFIKIRHTYLRKEGEGREGEGEAGKCPLDPLVKVSWRDGEKVKR